MAEARIIAVKLITRLAEKHISKKRHAMEWFTNNLEFYSDKTEKLIRANIVINGALTVALLTMLGNLWKEHDVALTITKMLLVNLWALMAAGGSYALFINWILELKSLKTKIDSMGYCKCTYRKWTTCRFNNAGVLIFTMGSFIAIISGSLYGILELNRILLAAKP